MMGRPEDPIMKEDYAIDIDHLNLSANFVVKNKEILMRI